MSQDVKLHAVQTSLCLGKRVVQKWSLSRSRVGMTYIVSSRSTFRSRKDLVARWTSRRSQSQCALFLMANWLVLSRLHVFPYLTDQNDSSEMLWSIYASGRRVPSVVNGSPNLLLGIPFYVYEELAWTSATFGNITMEELARRQQGTKHFDDFFFMKSSLVHPMRTMDPSVAKLFVIPTLMNAYVSRAYFSGEEFTLCYRGRCDKRLLRSVIPVLRDSTWFQQYPERHIVVHSHFDAVFHPRTYVPNALKAMLSQVNAITFEDQVPNQQERLRFPSTYVGSPCKIQKEKTQDVALTATMKTGNVKFQDRTNICQWILNATSANTLPNNHTIRMSQCGPGLQCPALARAKYGFHTRGDTYGSQRPIDTILSGTVPIFTRREQYDILPSWLDWRKMSVLLPLNEINDQREFLNRLDDILQDTEGYNDRHHAVLQHRDLVDWNTLHPFDMYMYSLQAELYPETRHKTDIVEHIFPALKLPPPIS